VSPKRPLEDIYPIVFLDCMVIKVRDGGTVQRRALYLALGVTLEGDREVLGIWFQETEGAKFWMQVLTDLKQRGVQDILIACRRADRLPGRARTSSITPSVTPEISSRADLHAVDLFEVRLDIARREPAAVEREDLRRTLGSGADACGRSGA